MKRRRISRKAAALALLIGLVLSSGGVAFGYFVATGSGSGAAPVALGPGNVFVFSTDGPGTPLYPGDGGQSFDLSIDNTGDMPAHVGLVYLSVATYEDTGDAATAGGDDIPGCSASWFTVTPSVDVDDTVAADSTVTANGLDLTEPTIGMSDNGDQDACEGASVGIDFSTTDPAS